MRPMTAASYDRPPTRLPSRHERAVELAPSEDLSERLKRGPIPVGEAIEIAKQIAEALEPVAVTALLSCLRTP